jgi:hypothetical protein
LGIEHDLNYAFPVTQVDEHLPAMVTTPMHPARQSHLLTGMPFP